MRRLGWLLFAVQLVLSVRVFRRMAATSSGRSIGAATTPAHDRVSVIVPVLNEATRLGPCLEGLTAAGPEVVEILVVDGGSTDATHAIVREWEGRDARVRLVDATPVPDGVNGKAHNLRAGAAVADPDVRWLLTIDADVRPRPELPAALLEHAQRDHVQVLSVATAQRLADPIDGMVHPSMLTTLVYRFGIPGNATIDPARVQANGQCMLIHVDALRAAGGFASVLGSICEDVTLARSAALAGDSVGFYEAGDLVSVEMYASWRDTWANWARSLPLRDRHSGVHAPLGLLEVTLVQAAPLWLALFGRGRVRQLNLGLLLARIGVLAGTRRAYRQPPPTYWLSPVCDLPVAIRLWLMMLRRRHTWRGRSIDRGGSV